MPPDAQVPALAPASLGAARPGADAQWLARARSALLAVDAAGTLTWANAGAMALLPGLSANDLRRPLAEALGLAWPGTRILGAALHAREGSAELKAARAGTQPRWLRIESAPLDGGGFLVSLADADSRRAAELGRRFELATATAGIGYWSLEGSAERARWSDQLRVLHGLPPGVPEPTLDEWLRTYVHPDDRGRIGRQFAAWVTGSEPGVQGGFRIVRGDGEVRHVISHSRVENPGPHPVRFGVVIDVTERRSAEMELRRATERAALAARAVGLGTWELDLGDGTALWDEQMWRLRGLEPQPVALDAGQRRALVHRDDLDRIDRLIEHSLDKNQSLDHEFRIIMPDGRVRWLASRSTPITDERGRVVRRIGVNWDITDSRSAQAARAERELALRESQAKSRFLARMSHELRTPMNAVLGFSQLLIADESGDSPGSDSRRRRLEHIHGAGRHLLSLINDVLELTSVEGGEREIVLAPVPLAGLVTATLPLVDELVRENGLELVSGALEGVVRANETRLRQVLLNLLSNAAKYNRPGGRIVVEARQQPGAVVLRVSDTGRGMSAEQLRHLFEPFNRLGIDLEGIEGTGIGLVIVKTLVERMGGSLQVRSRVGEGSVFEVHLVDAERLPVAQSPTPPLADEAAPALRGTLLYVEDNPVNAMIIAEFAALRPGLQLQVAADGVSALARARALRPDLVLLDMQLPDIDGLEVMRRLRADPATAAIPVIALSANAMPEDIERALRAGISDYWTKPLDVRTFLASMDALFGSA
jgi:PAS domain S-box-containing protein